jgi:hypothetical protein
MNKIDYTSDKVIQDIYTSAMEVFGHGIAVPSELHPCGWAWIDFSYIDIVAGDNILIHTFYCSEINDGWGEDSLDGLTLKQILEKTEGRFLFEINTNIDWDRERNK